MALTPGVSSRGGFLRGKGFPQNDNRSGFVNAELTSNSKRSGFLRGQGFDVNSSRYGYVAGYGSGSSDYRGGFIDGVGPSTSDRYGYLRGHSSGSDYRGGYLYGYSSGSDYRGGFIHGVGFSILDKDRGGYLRGRSSGSDYRGGYVRGEGSGSSDYRGGFISGSAYPYDHQEFISSVIDLGSDYTNYKWYYDWFAVTRETATYTVYVRSEGGGPFGEATPPTTITSPWEEVTIGQRIPRNRLKRYYQFKFKVLADRAFYFTLHQCSIKALSYTGPTPPDPGVLPQY